MNVLGQRGIQSRGRLRGVRCPLFPTRRCSSCCSCRCHHGVSEGSDSHRSRHRSTGHHMPKVHQVRRRPQPRSTLRPHIHHKPIRGVQCTARNHRTVQHHRWWRTCQSGLSQTPTVHSQRLDAQPPRPTGRPSPAKVRLEEHQRAPSFPWTQTTSKTGSREKH